MGAFSSDPTPREYFTPINPHELPNIYCMVCQRPAALLSDNGNLDTIFCSEGHMVTIQSAVVRSAVQAPVPPVTAKVAPQWKSGREFI